MFTPNRKTKDTASSVHIVREVLDSIAGLKPIFIALLFQRESSLNAFQILQSLSYSFIPVPLRWSNVLLIYPVREMAVLAYHVGCSHCCIPHVFGCYILWDVRWLHASVKIYQLMTFSSRSRLRRACFVLALRNLHGEYDIFFFR